MPPQGLSFSPSIDRAGSGVLPARSLSRAAASHKFAAP
jgi:hypothetical protein